MFAADGMQPLLNMGECYGRLLLQKIHILLLNKLILWKIAMGKVFVGNYHDLLLLAVALHISEFYVICSSKF